MLLSMEQDLFRTSRTDSRLSMLSLSLLLILGSIGFSKSLDGREGAVTSEVKPVGPTIIDIRMPKVRPIKDDHYICTAKSVEELGTQYINKFEPVSDADRAHHMLLFTCDNVDDDLLSLGSWDCNHHKASCRHMNIIYAWAKNAPPTILPKDVGFRIGTESNIKFLVLQVHYAHPMPEGTQDDSGFKVYTSDAEPTYLAGIMILMKGFLIIPPFTEKTHADMNCLLEANSPIVPFATRVHTHKLGSVVSGYYVKSGELQFHPIAKGNPQWPQAFYPMKEKVVLNPKDLVAARCTYNTTDFDKETNIGATAGDEMCNLYIMFYTASRSPDDHYIACMDEQFEQVSTALPADSDVPLPRNKTLEEHAMGHGHNSHPGSEPDSGKRKSHTKKRPGISLDQFSEEPIPEYRGPPGSSDEDNRLGLDRKITQKSVFHVVPSWPDSSVNLGQASGVDFDTQGNVVVFHRGDRVWGYETFDNWNRFLQKDLGPIQSNTVYVIHPVSGKVLHEWGSNRFFMPHDITVAPNGDTFLTDVALHQVFKFQPGSIAPSLILGEAFVPGNDDKHFCKPAAVAVTTSGDFFVADGYCNSRIVKFDKSGRKLLQWGRAVAPSLIHRLGSIFSEGVKPPPYSFEIPHALALAEDQDMICVADRENGRIQCFSASSGTFLFLIDSPAFGGKLYSVAYSPIEGGTLFAVNGQAIRNTNSKVQGFVIPLRTRTITSVFSPGGNGFGQPHDIAVNRNATQVYVVGISQPYKVWRFDRNDDAKVVTVGRTGKGSQDSIPSQPLAIQSNKEVLPGTPQSSPVSSSSALLPKQAVDALVNEDDSFSNSVIIMAFLTIPILLLVGVGALLRLRSSGCCNKRKESKSFSEFFPPSAGFEKLRMDESDNENSDTEVEEFTLPSYKKSLRT